MVPIVRELGQPKTRVKIPSENRTSVQTERLDCLKWVVAENPL